jgi:multidrug efflux pump subunit AcrB
MENESFDLEEVRESWPYGMSIWGIRGTLAALFSSTLAVFATTHGLIGVSTGKILIILTFIVLAVVMLVSGVAALALLPITMRYTGANEDAPRLDRQGRILRCLVRDLFMRGRRGRR